MNKHEEPNKGVLNVENTLFFFIWLINADIGLWIIESHRLELMFFHPSEHKAPSPYGWWRVTAGLSCPLLT